METLGYGSHLIIDGLGMTSKPIYPEEVKSWLEELAEKLEPDVKKEWDISPQDSTDEGFSVLMVMAESHLSLHLFPAHKALSLRVFSRYDLRPEIFSSALKEGFGVLRLSSYLSNHCKTPSSNPERRLLGLLGDRHYSSIRLNKQLLF